MQQIDYSSNSSLQNMVSIGKKVAVGGAIVILGMVALRVFNLSSGVNSFAKGMIITASVITGYSALLSGAAALMLKGKQIQEEGMKFQRNANPEMLRLQALLKN